MPTSQNALPGMDLGDVISLDRIADHASEATIGVVKATTRMLVAASGWPRQDLSC